MSSDARVRWQADGMIRGSHDGPCIEATPYPHPCVKHKYALRPWLGKFAKAGTRAIGSLDIAHDDA